MLPQLQLAEVVQRLQVLESHHQPLEQGAKKEDKSGEGFVPRAELLRAFNVLNNTLNAKVKRVGSCKCGLIRVWELRVWAPASKNCKCGVCV